MIDGHQGNPMNPDGRIRIDDNYGCRLDPDRARSLGMLPGTEWTIESTDGHVALRRVEDDAQKVYVEVTSACDLDCRTCVRNAWNEEIGFMSGATFDRVIDSLGGMPSVRTVHFGGYGEPLAHPDIFDMLARVKALGLRTEMITNGTLLDDDRCDQLVATDLDLLVVSIDGAREPTYDGIRLGSELNLVLQNVKNLSAARYRAKKRKPDLGLSFVAMKDNLNELLELKRMSSQLRVSFIMVSNLLPHTDDMRDQVLYGTLTAVANARKPQPSRRDAMVSFPRIDFTPDTFEVLRRLLQGQGNVQLTGMDLTAGILYCRFVREGNVFVRWDGQVSPCMALLHSYPARVLNRTKHIRRHSFGSVNETPLAEIWAGQPYREFRERITRWAFAPCVDCGGCEMSESNQEDCFGNPAPVCGDCLWAQGIIQCP